MPVYRPSEGCIHIDALSCLRNTGITIYNSAEPRRDSLEVSVRTSRPSCQLIERIESILYSVFQVCWLEPEQTAGKVKPFFYTQGQAVLNRSFFPCADTPSVKITYSATIKVPHGLVAVMSASQWHEPSADGEFRFTMDKPIPSYLIALAIGDLESAEIGPRCDILIMPPSFPFGGMENPCLTFVTPCLLAGDHSLVDVLIHEISHSWFGNLVTNADWGEFWLNEGFTMYAQRRITTMIFGHAYMCLEAATGRALLRQHIDTTGEEHPLNKLRVKIEPGVDPDDTYNETPYEKGFCFVSYLAHLVGDQKRFDDFLKAYVEKFKFQSVVAEDMLNFYLGYFPELKQQDVANKPGLEFEHWLNVPGWPRFLPDLSPGDELMKPANDLANLWSSPEVDLEKVKQIDISLWKTYQTVYFLDRLLEKSPLPSGNMVLLEKTYPKVSKTKNSELRLRWTQIIGKQKYTLPIYRALWASSETARKLALSTFQDTKKQLHINVQNYVSKILM
uniref:Arginyl aminopeptidase (aminopeptidase B) n=1 Tax=Eptatretus burgeri TaxID=7764 RepID=A0A8C4QKR7_EPTBU